MSVEHGQPTRSHGAHVGSPPPIPPEFAYPPFDGTKRGVISPALWIAGAMLWTYIIAGQHVVEERVPEILGVLAMLLAFVATWLLAVSPKFTPPPHSRQHQVGATLLALLFFGGTLVLGLGLAAMARRGAEPLVTLLLWTISVVMFFAGRRNTPRTRLATTTLQRATVVALWLMVITFTLAAVLPVLSEL